MSDLPRRVRDDDPTRSPMYLLQRRTLRWRLDVMGAGLEWSEHHEALIEDHGDGSITIHTDESLISRDWARWGWDTVGVFFTREEADEYCRTQHYNGPFRSFSVPAEGALEKLINAQTDKRGGEDG